MTISGKKIALAVAGLASIFSIVSPAAAANRNLKINNYADQAIYRMYVTRSTYSGWGGDQLGDGVISANRSMLWNIYDGTTACTFDFKFVMADGSTRVKYNYNVCAEYYLNVLD